MKKLAIALLLLTAATPLAAATWTAVGPYFGHVLSIAVDPVNPDRLWVSTHGGGVWRSGDGGATWSHSGKELSDRVVSYVVIQPKSNVLWAGVEPSSLARSKDGGQTWEWMRNDLTDTPFIPVIDPSNPKAIWIPSTNLHVRSSDGGAKWTEFRVTGGDVRVFAIHPKDSKTIWAGGTNGRSGLWRSTDGGATWKQLGKGLPESNSVEKLVVDPSQPDTLYMAGRRGGFTSTDGGESWTPFGGPTADAEIESLTATAGTVFVGSNKGFFRSKDGAQSWTKIGSGLPRYIVDALAVHPTNPDVMWVGASGAGIYKTTDGGKSWTESNRGFAASWIDNVWGDAKGMMFAQLSRGLFRADGNGGWVEIVQPFSDDHATVSTIVFDANRPVIHAGWSWSYYRSTDGGAHWSDVAKPFQEPRPSFSSVVPDSKNPKVLYSADQSTSGDEPAVFKSVDGGVKWKPANRGVTGSIVSLRADAANALLALGKDGKLFRSVDGATTWTAIGAGLPTDDLKTLAPDPSDPSRIYVAAKDDVYRSTDSGATFAGLKIEDPNDVAVDAKGNVYVASGEGVSRSSDGGKTWKPFREGLTNGDVRALHSAGTRLYAGTAGGGVFWIALE
jgi:photosystem II stability/assembly factor-like uncharacterized protein